LIEQFISARFTSSGCDRVVIGVSGGLDSALNLKLLEKVVGPDRIEAFFLPYGKLSEPDERFSKIAAENSSIDLKVVDISPIVDSIPIVTDGMVKGNLMARSRMIYLYTVANKDNGLVIGTSNKTEILMGYYTKFGDGAADIYPTGDLFKTQTRHLAKELEVSEDIITRPPSAGLMEGQTDEGEIGIPYPLLDQIIVGILSGYDDTTIADNIDHTNTSVEEMDRSNFHPPVTDEHVDRVRQTIRSTRHKRCGLPIPKVNPMTVGIDLRERW
jgi:NAD+ synthase